MKHLSKVLAIALAICTLASSFAFAATPSVSFVNPVADTVVSGTELSVSLKVSNKKKISVSIFEEKEVIGTKQNEETKAVEEILKSINVEDFTNEMLVALNKDFSENKKIELGEEQNQHIIRQVLVGEASSFTAKDSLTVFTKTIKDLAPGLFMIQVDVVAEDGSIAETYISFIALQKPLQEKPEEQQEVHVEAKVNVFDWLTKALKDLAARHD